jgi:hypothetical protein
MVRCGLDTSQHVLYKDEHPVLPHGVPSAISLTLIAPRHFSMIILRDVVNPGAAMR